MSRSWLEKNYKIGETIQAPHPQDTASGNQPAEITTLTTDAVSHPFPKGPTGIMVKFEDDTFMEIDAGYLNENGGGIV